MEIMIFKFLMMKNQNKIKMMLDQSIQMTHSNLIKLAKLNFEYHNYKLIILKIL
jgi:hypothetical protein